MRILIVDELEENLLALEVLLRRPGREVVCLRFGAEAIAELSRAPVALAVLDVMMPKMNGIDTADALRAIDPKLRIVFVSAAADDNVVQRAARRLGAVGCLLLPIDTVALETIVADAEAARSRASGNG